MLILLNLFRGWPRYSYRQFCGTLLIYWGTGSAVLRIRDILVRIRIRGSVPLYWSGSGSGYLQDGNQKLVFLPYFLKLHLHHFSKTKSGSGSTAKTFLFTKISLFYCWKQPGFPESWPLIFYFLFYFFYLCFPFYFGSGSISGTGMHSGSRSAKTKSCGSSGSGSTTLINAPDCT